MFSFNIFKLLQRPIKILVFSMGGPSQTVRKNVWYFTLIISIFIFGTKQKYLNLMKKKILQVMKIDQLPP